MKCHQIEKPSSLLNLGMQSSAKNVLWHLYPTIAAADFYKQSHKFGFSFLRMGFGMALILDGNSEIGAHVKSSLCYLICLRHMII